MKQLFIPILTLLVACSSNGQTPVHSIFLVGDAGEPAIVSQPLGSRLKAQIDSSRHNTTVLFLGDNIYPMGMPGKNTRNRTRAEAILSAQVGWVQNATQAIFVPGNHHWQREKKEGHQYILNQQGVGHVTKQKHKCVFRTVRNSINRSPRVVDHGYAMATASLHEHALQYIVDGQSKFIVTGSGSKSSHVKKKGSSKFAASRQGFSRIDVFDDGSLALTFWVVDKKSLDGKLVLHANL